MVKWFILGLVHSVVIHGYNDSVCYFYNTLMFGKFFILVLVPSVVINVYNDSVYYLTLDE